VVLPMLAVAADGVDLVDEHDARRALLGGLQGYVAMQCA
jgi:hypothetical protein